MLPFPMAFKWLEIFIDVNETEALKVDFALSADADMGDSFAIHDVAFVVAKGVFNSPVRIWLNFRIKLRIRSRE